MKALGVGEACDTGLGNTSFFIRGNWGTPTTLLDCGYQIPERFWMEKDYYTLELVCITHLHADHFLGLVPLIARFYEEKRKRKITFFAPKGFKSVLTTLLQKGYPGLLRKLPFQLHFKDWVVGKKLSYSHLVFSCAQTRHTVPNYAIRVDFKKAPSASLVVSGDGHLTPGVLNLVKRVKYFFSETYSLHPLVGAPHNSLGDSLRLLRKLEIGKIGVTHCRRTERKKIASTIQKLKKKDSRWHLVKPSEEFKLY